MASFMRTPQPQQAHEEAGSTEPSFSSPKPVKVRTDCLSTHREISNASSGQHQQLQTQQQPQHLRQTEGIGSDERCQLQHDDGEQKSCGQKQQQRAQPQQRTQQQQPQQLQQHQQEAQQQQSTSQQLQQSQLHDEDIEQQQPQGLQQTTHSGRQRR